MTPTGAPTLFVIVSAGVSGLGEFDEVNLETRRGDHFQEPGRSGPNGALPAPPAVHVGCRKTGKRQPASPLLGQRREHCIEIVVSADSLNSQVIGQIAVLRVFRSKP
jgi:hypothetical protein